MKFHHSAAGAAWRWRTELAILTIISAALWRLALLITLIWAALALAALVAGLLGLPVTRRFITARFWCVLARHRLQRLCWEARLHTRSGRLPLILWTRPTKVGERIHLLCRAGICAEDFDAHIGELRAACYARDARVTRNRRWSQLVTIDIIRHDTLAASELIKSPLQRLTEIYQLDLVPAQDSPESGSPLPDTARQPPDITPGGCRAHHPPGRRQPMTTTDTRPLAPVPTFPFSMFDPVHLGVDEYGEPIYVNLAERNMLLGGEPGGGKSSAENLIVAHGALSHDCRLVLVDGNQVQLGPWRHSADMFIGPSLPDAKAAFTEFQQIMNHRYERLLATGRRKITRDDGEDIYLVVIDEYAYFSATVGKKQDREEFAALARDLIARGRAAGVILILATQRPAHQIIDPSMRDLFSYRLAFRCTTDSSSDVVLGQGWAGKNYTAAEIDPLARGVAWLLSETGVPRRIKTAWLDDDTIKYLAAYAARLRRKDAAA